MGVQPVGCDPRSGALRELKGETGLVASELTEVIRIDLSSCASDETEVGCVAEILVQGDTDLDETEDLQIRKLPLAEAVCMAMTGEITDSFSVAVFLKIAALKSGL
jgi:8-oxo-dGTP pyrophosphatase MutT (NUDIX family)